MKDIIISNKKLSFMKDLLRVSNPTLTLNELLILISINEGINSLNEISSYIFKDKSSIHKSLQNLKRKRLIIESSTINRVIYYSITPLGKNSFEYFIFKYKQFDLESI